MSTPFSPDRYGDFPLSGVAGLPNASVAFPGEHWSNAKAIEDIVPGECVIPVGSGGALYVKRATAAESVSPRAAVALWPVLIPDGNNGSEYGDGLGPNQLVNRTIPRGEYVHRYNSGNFLLTLIVPDDSYAPGDLIGWDPGGARPAGKAAGTGAWKKVGSEAAARFEVDTWQPFNEDGEGILIVRGLQGQF